MSKNKEQSAAYAASYFKKTSPELAEDLTSRPVDKVHDVADACLLAIMWLQEHCSMPILNSQPCPLPSGCPVSKALSFSYAKANVNGRPPPRHPTEDRRCAKLLLYSIMNWAGGGRVCAVSGVC